MPPEQTDTLPELKQQHCPLNYGLGKVHEMGGKPDVQLAGGQRGQEIDIQGRPPEPILPGNRDKGSPPPKREAAAPNPAE